MSEFYEAFSAGKSMMEQAIFDALPQVYISSFGMIQSGEVNQVIAGALTIIGITSIIITGLWKLVLKVLGRRLFDSIPL